MRWLLVVWLGLAGAALAQDQGALLTPEAFEAKVRGRTLEMQVATNVWVMQRFLSDGKLIQYDASGCRWARWQAVDGQICLNFRDKPGVLQCWSIAQSGDALQGWYQGDMAFPPIAMRVTDKTFDCGADWL